MGRGAGGHRLSGFSAETPPGALTWQGLLNCYASGVFPMGEARDDPTIFLVEPDARGVIPLDDFHIPSRLARTVRQDRFDIAVDGDFAGVLDACAEAAADRPGTWINTPIRALYAELFQRGFAHSVECRQDGHLVGGLYGVSLGGAFFGESMFSRRRDASKVALVHLVARLRRGGWTLLDAQFLTEHLEQFGAMEIPRPAYLRRLAVALGVTPDVSGLGAPMAGEDAVARPQALQPITQAS